MPNTNNGTGCCPTNATCATAKTISLESLNVECICCPGAEQWFKFTATKNARYTILTTGEHDTIGTLYDSDGNQIVEVDNYEPCGKLNFRIIQDLEAGVTYYIKVRLKNNDIGSYMLKVTESTLADSVTINKNSITLDKGILYELPITPNYTYKGYNGARRIPGLSVDIIPSNADEQKVFWYVQTGSILNCIYDWDDDGDRYIHVIAFQNGTTNLRAQDWNENGKIVACDVCVRDDRVTGISLDRTSMTVNLDDTKQLTAIVTPSTALNKNVVWSSSCPNKVEVDSTGKITANAVGTAIITAQAGNGQYAAQCAICVVNGIIIEKDPETNNSQIIFPYGIKWNYINKDYINEYTLSQTDEESQRFYDNAYETKYIDVSGLVSYFKPMKEYFDDEIKLLYAIDPLGVAAYVREYAENLPGRDDSPQEMLEKIIGYKDRIFTLLFNRAPHYFARNAQNIWYKTSSYSNLLEVISESELLFGMHTVYDAVTLQAFLNVAIDLISIVLQCPAFSGCAIAVAGAKLIKYYSLAHSVGSAVLNNDFNELLSAIVNGIINDDALDDDFITPSAYKSKNYTIGWAFDLWSLSSNLQELANTFNIGPHFYKEVLTMCSLDAPYDVYIRTPNDDLVAISDIKNAIN